MFHRLAIYYAPARDSALCQRAEAWLARPELAELTVSARRYGFHATLKAPFRSMQSMDALRSALRGFADGRKPVEIGVAAPRLLGGFLALMVEPQPETLTQVAAEVVAAFEPFRAPLDEAERARRYGAELSARQRELIDLYGYPYVFEEFLFHMTLTDSLAEERRAAMVAEARAWFAEALSAPLRLDRLVLFGEKDAGGAFVRLEDFMLGGAP
jgi:uncharacterized protein DUF1045